MQFYKFIIFSIIKEICKKIFNYDKKIIFVGFYGLLVFIKYCIGKKLFINL